MRRFRSDAESQCRHCALPLLFVGGALSVLCPAVCRWYSCLACSCLGLHLLHRLLVAVIGLCASLASPAVAAVVLVSPAWPGAVFLAGFGFLLLLRQALACSCCSAGLAVPLAFPASRFLLLFRLSLLLLLFGLRLLLLFLRLSVLILVVLLRYEGTAAPKGRSRTAVLMTPTGFMIVVSIR